jgi:DNA polymerase-1
MIKEMTFGSGDNVTTVILVTPRDFNKAKLEESYIQPLLDQGHIGKILVIQLLMNSNGKAPAVSRMREWMEKIYPALNHLKVERLIVTQGGYFKALVGQNCTNSHARVFDIDAGIPTLYMPSVGRVYFDPQVADQITETLATVIEHQKGIEKEQVELDIQTTTLVYKLIMQKKLQKMLLWPIVFVDIETTGLELGFNTELVSISFSPDKGNATVYYLKEDKETLGLLRDFFEQYKGKVCMHNCTFDSKHLIWHLFMEHDRDYEGMLHGLDCLFRNMEDTMAMAYLCLNNTAKAQVGLKTLAYEYIGSDWGAVINFDDCYFEDNLEEFLYYNGQDTCATAYVYDKFVDQVAEEQESVYRDVFLPSLKTITLMELVGLPLNLATVLEKADQLQGIQTLAQEKILAHKATQEALGLLREAEVVKANAKLKKLVKTVEDFDHYEFNPRSSHHLRVLLYDVLGMKIRKTTASGLPSTSSDALDQMADFLKHNNDPNAELMEWIQEANKVAIINSTFIPALRDKSEWFSDGWRYLQGSFNLGGTVSGRMSSSNPNLQNIPSTGTPYAKAIKECFEAPKGWLMVGADYFSLEDRISALQTRDPNKLAVYLEGYDGHSLRAYSYFRDQMADITAEIEAEPERKVEIINSIEHRYKSLRQLSKGPTFALTYMGTWKTLVENFGLSKKEAIQIEEEYHKLYKVSDDWVKEQLHTAQETGYVELAFGLRLRTPALPRCMDIRDKLATLPYEAYSEMKTAGNALGQSYGLLNNYSANMFMQRVWTSKYRHDILPIAQIHDSQYYLIRNTLGHIKFVNDNLVECMEWCELPAIKHEEVGLGSSLDIFWPTWNDIIAIPNRASLSKIKECILKARN